MRNLKPEQITALKKGGFEFGLFIYIELEDEPLALCTTPYSIDHDGKHFLASPYVLDIDDIELDGAIRVNEIDLQFSHVDYAIDQTLQRGWMNRTIQISLGLIQDQKLIPPLIPLREGYISTYHISEGKDESTLSLSIASIWADFEKTMGRSTNDSSQQKIYPGDTSMQWASKAKKDKGEWGY